jgi:serine/threonine protein kinase
MCEYKPHGPKADIFMVGIVVFEILTGDHPFYNEDKMTLQDLFDKILNVQYEFSDAFKRN